MCLAGKTKLENVARVPRGDDRDVGFGISSRECWSAIQNQICVLDDADRDCGERYFGQDEQDFFRISR